MSDAISRAAGIGAALGSVVPGVGTAVGGAVGALGGLAATMVPSLARFLFGPQGEAVGAAVGQIAAAVTGTPEPDAQLAVIERDPKVAEDFRLKLLQLQAQHEEAQQAAFVEELKARLTDTKDARATMVTLASAHSVQAYGAMLVSAFFLIGLLGFAFLILHYEVSDKLAPILTTMLAIFAAGVGAVGNYWLGSSASSATKNMMLYNSAPTDNAGKQS